MKKIFTVLLCLLATGCAGGIDATFWDGFFGGLDQAAYEMEQQNNARDAELRRQQEFEAEYRRRQQQNSQPTTEPSANTENNCNDPNASATASSSTVGVPVVCES